LQETNLKLARVTLARAQDASRRGFGVISPLEIDQNRAQVDQCAANLELAQANLASAQINYDFTEVRAPITAASAAPRRCQERRRRRYHFPDHDRFHRPDLRLLPRR